MLAQPLRIVHRTPNLERTCNHFDLDIATSTLSWPIGAALLTLGLRVRLIFHASLRRILPQRSPSSIAAFCATGLAWFSVINHLAGTLFLEPSGPTLPSSLRIYTLALPAIGMSSNPTETGGRPSNPTPLQQEVSTQAPALRRERTISQSSDERLRVTEFTSSHRRSDSRREASGPHAGSSRGSGPAMQRSTSPGLASPDASDVHYTRTGRVSKAKKGRKVHDCECGKSYTRAEHLRRHQKNHAAPLACGLPGCGKTFHRADLLQRHQEKHNETSKPSRQASHASEGTVPKAEAPLPASPAIPTPAVTTIPLQTTNYFSHAASPPPEVTTPPSQLKQRSFDAHHASMSVSVPVDGTAPGVAWHEPYSPCQNYSSSSEYASPNLNVDCMSGWASAPYGLTRTRTSSIASFAEAWGYPVQTPTSPASAMGCNWIPDEKMASTNFAYMNETAYPLAGLPAPATIEPVPAYGFEPKLMAELDELFPETFGTFTHLFPSCIDLHLSA